MSDTARVDDQDRRPEYALGSMPTPDTIQHVNFEDGGSSPDGHEVGVAEVSPRGPLNPPQHAGSIGPAGQRGHQRLALARLSAESIAAQSLVWANGRRVSTGLIFGRGPTVSAPASVQAKLDGERIRYEAAMNLLRRRREELAETIVQCARDLDAAVIELEDEARQAGELAAGWVSTIHDLRVEADQAGQEVDVPITNDHLQPLAWQHYADEYQRRADALLKLGENDA
jgi:hypothetical protein